jgi:hypothetical protein
MHVLAFLASLALILLTLIDGFETILQPRRITHRFRYARLFYRNTWKLWRGAALVIPAGKRREAFLSIFGPLSLLGLFATWMLGLILGFGLLHWSMHTTLYSPDHEPKLTTYIYLSGTTFFTLGYGDVTPTHSFGRALAVAESGLGFAFLAVVIGYLPVLYQAYSRREVTIALLDARAGSPPSAAQLLLRLARSNDTTSINSFLDEWERWAADLLESHLSFPVLGYYRSQHDNQSWLAALTTILDTCALLIVQVKTPSPYLAQLTFAMARHAAVDLALVLKVAPATPEQDRLPPQRLQDLRDSLRQAGLDLHETSAVNAQLTDLRAMYEPFLHALSRRFLFTLPRINPPEVGPDNWQRSALPRRPPGIGQLRAASTDNDHFE